MIIVLSINFHGDNRINDDDDDDDDSQRSYSAIYLLTHSEPLARPVTTQFANMQKKGKVWGLLWKFKVH